MMIYAPLSGLIAALISLGTTLWISLSKYWLSTHEGSDGVKQFLPVALTTCGWAALLYVFLFFQSYCTFHIYQKYKKEAKKKDGDSNAPSFRQVKYEGRGSKLNLCANRTVGNYLEQTPAFLLAIWMCAIFVDIKTATLYGWLWILFRAIYPIVFYVGGLLLFVSTIPAYFCVWYMLWRVVAAAAAT